MFTRLWLIFFKKRNRNSEIYPDEIFMDSQNLPEFDLHQFEGRVERPLSKKTFAYLFLVFAATASIFLFKVFDLSVMKGKVYAEISRNNSLEKDLIIAPRGVIYDRNGVKLAWNKVKEEGEDFSRREYVESAGFAHLLGFLKYPAKDSSGFYYREEYEPENGVELHLNEILTGHNGLKITERDALGYVVSGSFLEKPREGEKAELSVDSRIQKKMYEAIAKTVADVGFKGGAGVMMDVRTGEILAMVNFPEYDLQAFEDERDAALLESYAKDERNPFLNRAFSGLYAPGSIVKPIVAFAALEEDIINPEKQILSTGQLVVPNPYFPDQPSIFKDWKAHGLVDMRRALAVSSDVYFYQIGGGFGSQKGLGITKLKEYFKKFGFEQSFNVGWPEETGLIPSPDWKEKVFGEEWRLGDTYNTSIGQYGMQITPMQAVRAISAVANEGYLLEPTFLKQATSSSVIVGRSKDIKETDQKNWEIVKEGMRMAASNGGTAAGLSMTDVEIAAKTGTAEIGAAKKFVNSWSVGFFPYEEPRYAFAVVMERGPASNLVGATYIMRQVMEYIVSEAPEYIK